MPSVKLSPLFNDAQLDNNGLPLSGGMVYWYLAGTTTPTIVYAESSGSVANTNPVLLNTRGEVPKTELSRSPRGLYSWLGGGGLEGKHRTPAEHPVRYYYRRSWQIAARRAAASLTLSLTVASQIIASSPDGSETSPAANSACGTPAAGDRRRRLPVPRKQHRHEQLPPLQRHLRSFSRPHALEPAGDGGEGARCHYRWPQRPRTAKRKGRLVSASATASAACPTEAGCPHGQQRRRASWGVHLGGHSPRGLLRGATPSRLKPSDECLGASAWGRADRRRGRWGGKGPRGAPRQGRPSLPARASADRPARRLRRCTHGRGRDPRVRTRSCCHGRKC